MYDAKIEMKRRALDAVYRPRTFAQCIGHERAVATMSGYVKSGNIPATIILTGPMSAGKTTLGRVLAGEINGWDQNKNPIDFHEVDGTTNRGIDELKRLVASSKFMPMGGQMRVIMIDEFQHVIANKAASPVLLKELEEPAPNTLWILASMDPAAISADKTGAALLSRCRQFHLEPHTNQDLFKQGTRIVKGERMTFMTKEVLQHIVKMSGNRMRVMSHMLADLAAYYAGLPNKPKTLSIEDVKTQLVDPEQDQADSVYEYLVGMLNGKFADAQRAILDVNDPTHFVNGCLWGAQFLLNNAVLNGARHPKVWWTPLNKRLHSAVGKKTLNDYGALLSLLVKVKSQLYAYPQPLELLTALSFGYMTGNDGD